MKLFIFTEVLVDYTGGMAVIAAETVEDAIEIAVTTISESEKSSVEHKEWIRQSFKNGEVKVIDEEIKKAEMISYVYGGM